MLAVVKEPHIELSLGGKAEKISEVLSFLRKRYTVIVLVSPQEDTDDDESVNVFETDFWKKTTPGMLLAGYRLKHEMTQEQLAEKSGIHHAVISAYENGKRKLSRKAAIKLAKALDEDPENFFKNVQQA